MTNILPSKIWISLLVSGEVGPGAVYLISQGWHPGPKKTPGCWFGFQGTGLPGSWGCNVVQDLQFGAAEFSFLPRGPNSNNRVQAHSGLVPNSYEETLGRKGVRKIGASRAVSWTFAFAHTLTFLLL